MHNLATQLKKIRLEKNLTQKQVAKGIDITEQSYQRYEYGRVVPSATVLIALANFFDIPLDCLVGAGLYGHLAEHPEIRKPIEDAIIKVMGDNISWIQKYFGVSLSQLDEITFVGLANSIISKVELHEEDHTVSIYFRA